MILKDTFTKSLILISHQHAAKVVPYRYLKMRTRLWVFLGQMPSLPNPHPKGAWKTVSEYPLLPPPPAHFQELPSTPSQLRKRQDGNSAKEKPHLPQQNGIPPPNNTHVLTTYWSLLRSGPTVFRFLQLAMRASRSQAPAFSKNLFTCTFFYKEDKYRS